MDAGNEKNGYFYAVLGLQKECSDSDLRNAYKKLALRWHPDRCTASGKTEVVDEAKEKFQEISEAYSILSDSNKRFLYDVGIYDSGDDGSGMGEFLDDMAQMMSQTKPSDRSQETFENLQQLFVEMFQADLDLDLSTMNRATDPIFMSNGACQGFREKRGSSTMDTTADKAKFEELDTGSDDFCFGVNGGTRPSGEQRSKRRNGRKQRTSSKHDISSNDAETST
ncbi:hypothetical protein HPP92_015587 [Vanilla planifolia]|uniref:J domain-containing protein n=1 Tax=Vanilla planifolia TaxID=51239 RepID=A0A835UTE5_VANPL|nr:hypothetical protein HPP92_016243 [Vanilla planifolia]KAG0471041.1 hypothetical protein HPP92_015587 [Vanilla planifolia]